MRLSSLLLLALNITNISSSFSQGNPVFDSRNFEYCKRLTVAIGVIDSDTITNKNQTKKIINNFRPIGSGLLSYTKIDTSIFYVIISAKHVFNEILNQKFSHVYIRLFWSDTLKTDEYQGLQIPLYEKDGDPNFFIHPNYNIDLGCLFISDRYLTDFFLKKVNESSQTVFPINSIRKPRLGDQVWIFGYPEHIENALQSEFSYCISTFKPGYITWIPNEKMQNKDLNHIMLVESNATHGNSGGPVFSSDSTNIILAGILVSGYKEKAFIFSPSSPKPLSDQFSKGELYASVRSGVSIIENSNNILTLLNYVNKELNIRFKKNGSL